MEVSASFSAAVAFASGVLGAPLGADADSVDPVAQPAQVRTSADITDIADISAAAGFGTFLTLLTWETNHTGPRAVPWSPGRALRGRSALTATMGP